MSESERNKLLLLLLQDLIEGDEKEYIQLIETMVKKDTESMQKSFSIMTEFYLNKSI